MNTFLHEIAITIIVSNKDKYLITRRSQLKKRYPGMWVVPGGRVETTDYKDSPKDTEFHWANILEKVARREIREEVGLEIANINYVTSFASIHADGTPSLIISCMADYVSGDVKLQEEETDQYAWVTLDEAKNYQLIDGIYEQLVMADNIKKGKRSEWKRL